jgi:formylglycine-generating enzyme required for sulfatase activity
MAAQIRPHVLTAAAERSLKPGQSFRECAADCPEMIVIPAGSFTMGSSPLEKAHHERESPQHDVTIAQPFAVSKFELTFADWDACAKYGDCDQDISDSGWKRGRQPAINVTWDDAKRYVAWLSTMTGKTYRLLSEAEYEYATRAGTTTAYPWGNDIGTNNANCKSCGSKWDITQTAPVGSFVANRFGLYDMVGNVWEWVEDCVHNDYDGAPTDGSAWIKGGDCKSRIVRAGSWSSDPVNLRSAYRLLGRPRELRGGDLGFRVARTLLAP